MLGGTLQGKPNDSVRYGRNDVLALGSYLTVYLKTYRFSNFPFQGTLRQDRRVNCGNLNILFWRPGWESNPRIRVLQTLALPLGYPAIFYSYRGSTIEFKIFGICNLRFI